VSRQAQHGRWASTHLVRRPDYEPWLLEEGASGSSAGPGAANAAGLCGLLVGSETGAAS
jgi:Asp-tRNA(Asn)/Glu-tRNA(Gln) amidotransferase A subunit family amidase